MARRLRCNLRMNPTHSDTAVQYRLSRRNSLGERMVDQGTISEGQLARALAWQAQKGGQLGEALVRLGYASAHEVLVALSAQCRVPWVDLGAAPPDRALRGLIPEEFARKLLVVPIALEGARSQHLVVAIRAPANLDHVDLVRAVSGKVFVRAVIASDRALRAALDALYRNDA